MDRFPNVDLVIIPNTYLLIPSCIPLRPLSVVFSFLLQASLPRVEMEFLACRSHRSPGKVQPSSPSILTEVRNRDCSWGIWIDECFPRKHKVPLTGPRSFGKEKWNFYLIIQQITHVFLWEWGRMELIWNSCPPPPNFIISLLHKTNNLFTCV